MKIGEWWFDSKPYDKKEMQVPGSTSSDVLLEMAKKSLDKAQTRGGEWYKNFGPEIQPNLDIYWKCQLGNNEIFYFRIFPESLSYTEQLIIAHNWGKEGK